jgi:hypothetical protein
MHSSYVIKLWSLRIKESVHLCLPPGVDASAAGCSALTLIGLNILELCVLIRACQCTGILLSAESACQHYGKLCCPAEQLGAGTLPYMAPELLVSVRVGTAGAVTATNRVDIYAMAMIMWEMLAGTVPWSHLEHSAIIAAVSCCATCLRGNAEPMASTY